MIYSKKGRRMASFFIFEFHIYSCHTQQALTEEQPVFPDSPRHGTWRVKESKKIPTSNEVITRPCYINHLKT